jgi:serine/threonine-protein kinase
MTDLRTQLQDGLGDSYVLERELGRGGMATVFLARDTKHDRPVALKVLHPELAASLGPERFLREVKLAARLQHPHILTMLDSGQTRGTHEAGPKLWFTMPFVEGESLRDRLRRERQLPVEDALRICREAAQALQYAHEHGVIHRDIKPENLLLTRDGNTLVADFGIARALGGESDERLTETGVTVGTPAYMSPEQAAGDRALDPRTDLYSLAAVLYEMLAGEPPFTGATIQALMVKRLTEPPPSVRATRRNVPESVDQAIRRALSPVAADRFATMAQFGQALRTEEVTTTAAPTVVAPGAPAPSTTVQPAAKPPARTHGRPPVLALTLVLGIMIGLGVLFAWRRNHAGAEEPAGERRIAVLPFQNLGDSATEYFADGVTDAVRGKLSALSGLQVIASSSSNEYKHTSKPLPDIGRELGTDYLLIARIRWAKAADGTSRVEVSPELVDVSPGHPPTTKWQQSFEAGMTDVFRVQGEIAGQVASALNVALGAGQKDSLKQRPTQNLAAYDAFLKGDASQGLVVVNPPTLRAAISYYEQAVALDSTFGEAWSRLSLAQSDYYYAVTPNPASADAAKRAADKALALAPGGAEPQYALATYYQAVLQDNPRALAAAEQGLKAAPDHVELLTLAALTQQALGRWDEAVKYLVRAQALDPRAATTARRLSQSLIRLRRYPEALAAADAGLAVAPTNLDLLENKAMVYLAQGDLGGAQRVIQAAPAEIEPTALVAAFGNYWDLFWVLDDAQQQLLLRLPPSVWDGDRGSWGIILAQTYFVRGDRVKARAYADSSRVGTEETLRATPDDPQRHAFLGLALAYLGRKAEAMKEGERAVALAPASRDGYLGTYLQHLLVRTYILVGEPEKALDQLEPLLKMPYYLSPGWLKIDPAFEPLRKNPRFQKLVKGTA